MDLLFNNQGQAVGTFQMNYVPVDSESSSFLNLILKTDWKLTEDRKGIKKTFTFPDFASTFSFMTRIAFEAEKLNHHPDWSNVYNKLVITWSTHELDGLSEHDVKMAQFCDQVYCNVVVMN